MDTEQSSKVVENTVEVPQQETPVSQDSLSLNDLQLLANIVEVATQRGTFKANELVNVGTVYNKLSSFLAGIKAASEKKEAPQE